MPAEERWPPSHLSPAHPLPPPPPPSADMPPSAAQPLWPLLSYYRLLQRPLPPLRFIDPSLLPTPHSQLLHHNNNMTPTLAAFHHSPLHLHVLHQSVDGSGGGRCTRFVRLLTEANECVELGCIVIELDVLPSVDVRLAVLSGVRPFGGVLLEAGVKQLCEPSGFFQVEEDAAIRQAMGVDGEGVVSEEAGGEKVGRLLYGRCNVISDERGRVIARVVEILPPVDPSRLAIADEAEMP